MYTTDRLSELRDGIGARSEQGRLLDLAMVDEPDVVARLRGALPTADSTCDDIVSVLLSLARDASGVVLDEIRPAVWSAIAQRRWADAASNLRDSAWCQANGDTCQGVATALTAGCPVRDRWALLPQWSALTKSARARNASFEDDWATVHLGGREWFRATLVFDLVMSSPATLSCAASGGSTSVGVEVSMVHRQARLWAYVARADSSPSISYDTNGTAIWKMADSREPPDLLPRLAQELASTLSLSDLGEVRIGCMANGEVLVGCVADATEPQAGQSGYNWWDDYQALVVDSTPLRTLQRRPQDACAELVTSPAQQLPLVYMGFGDGDKEPLLVPSTDYLLALTSVMHGSVLQPVPLHVAPAVACTLTCPTGHRLTKTTGAAVAATAVSTYTDALDELSHLPANATRCARWLLADYVSCGSKVAAEARFGACMGLPVETLQALPSWWSATLGIPGSSSGGDGQSSPPSSDRVRATRTLAGLMSCSVFTDLQRRTCGCASQAVLDDPAEMGGLVPQTSARFTILPRQVQWRPQQDAALRARLHALGYGPFTSVEQQEHAMRLLSCATEGVYTFEVECDVGVVPCAIKGELCARAVISRRTCILPVPCASGLVGSDTDHNRLRALNAPRWVQPPSTGTGFRVATSGLSTFATSWVAEALVVAGRQFADGHMATAGADPIVVIAASSRDGGLASGTAARQTGLQLDLSLPRRESSSSAGAIAAAGAAIDWSTTEAQLQALTAAGFNLTVFAELGALGECTARGLQCAALSADESNSDESTARRRTANEEVTEPYIRATLHTLPSAESGNMLPLIVSATLAVNANAWSSGDMSSGEISSGDTSGEMASGGTSGTLSWGEMSASLTLEGYDFGHTAIDVLSVSVGTHDCTVTQWSAGLPEWNRPATIVAQCALTSPGWLRGLPSVVTASAGRGKGAQQVAAFLNATSTPDATAASPLQDVASGVRGDMLALGATVASVIEGWGAMVTALGEGDPPTVVTSLLPEVLHTLDAVALHEPSVTLVREGLARMASLQGEGSMTFASTVASASEWSEVTREAANRARVRLAEVEWFSEPLTALLQEIRQIADSVELLEGAYNSTLARTNALRASYARLRSAIEILPFDKLDQASKMVSSAPEPVPVGSSLGHVDLAELSTFLDVLSSYISTTLPTHLEPLGNASSHIAQSGLEGKLRALHFWLSPRTNDHPLKLVRTFMTKVDSVIPLKELTEDTEEEVFLENRRIKTREAAPLMKEAGEMVELIGAQFPTLVDTAIQAVTHANDVLGSAQGLHTKLAAFLSVQPPYTSGGGDGRRLSVDPSQLGGNGDEPAFPPAAPGLPAFPPWEGASKGQPRPPPPPAAPPTWWASLAALQQANTSIAYLLEGESGTSLSVVGRLLRNLLDGLTTQVVDSILPSWLPATIANIRHRLSSAEAILDRSMILVANREGLISLLAAADSTVSVHSAKGGSHAAGAEISAAVLTSLAATSGRVFAALPSMRAQLAAISSGSSNCLAMSTCAATLLTQFMSLQRDVRATATQVCSPRTTPAPATRQSRAILKPL